MKVRASLTDKFLCWDCGFEHRVVVEIHASEETDAPPISKNTFCVECLLHYAKEAERYEEALVAADSTMGWIGDEE